MTANTEFWRGRRVLVTGAGGFIGSHLAEALLAAGAHVRAFIHYNALGSTAWLDDIAPALRPNIDVIAGDIREYHPVREAAEGCDTVFHLAALIAIPYSYRTPLGYVRTNVEGTANILQAALECRARRVVTTSTSEVYGTARVVPITEEHPLQGQSPYAASKIGADALAESYARSFGLPVVVARPFNTFGPRQSTRAIIPAIIGQLMAGAGELRLGNLAPTRDLNYVSNTVDGFLALGAADAPTPGRAYNFGSNREVSIGDLAAAIMEVFGRRVPIVQDPARVRPAASEVERLIAGNARALDELGWKPSVGLEEGLARTIDWCRARPGLLAPAYRL